MGYAWWDDVETIADLARSKGLDFYDVKYEEITKKVMVELGTYILPFRYRHWTFGQEYGKLQKFHDLGILEILEMVINSNPARAYLLDSNTPCDHKMVIAHVYAHVDFFKHNYWFTHTNRTMIEEEQYFERRIKELSYDIGLDRVEEFLDILIPIQWYVDFFGQFQTGPKKDTDASTREHRDLLQYVIKNAEMEPWQSEIIEFIREESLYFIPNAMTKIMNEGWATFWHTEMMREYLTFEEFDQFAVKHSHLMSQKGLNPYKIGYLIYHDIKKRWDRDHGEGAGMEKIFEVRQFEDDTSFIRNYLTTDIAEECGLYLYEQDPDSGERKVTSTDLETIKAYIIGSIQNMGKPVIVVVGEKSRERERLRDLAGRVKSGDLLLRHRFDGRELDMNSAGDVLKSIQKIWSGSVHLLTVMGEDEHLLSYDGNDVQFDPCSSEGEAESIDASQVGAPPTDD